MESFNCGDTMPADLREVERVSCIRAGAVPALVKGQEVWVLSGPSWCVAVVGSRLPGGVYKGQIDGMARREGYVIICANIYGGVVS